MKKLFVLLAVLVLALGVTGSALAVDEELPHSGRVLFVAGGDARTPGVRHTVAGCLNRGRAPKRVAQGSAPLLTQAGRKGGEARKEKE